MLVGETNPELRRIPLTIRIADGSELASSVDASSPTVLVSSNGAALVPAGGTLAHVTGETHLHYYEASAAEALVPGFLLVIVMHASIETAIAWAPVGQIFAAGETDLTLLRLPLAIYDDGSPPQLATGATVTTGSDLQSSVNARAFGDDAGSLHEIGHGAYYWQATVASAAEVGFATVRYLSTGFSLAIATVDVEPPPTGLVASAPVGPAAILAPITLTDSVPTIDLVARALSRLPQMYRGTNG